MMPSTSASHVEHVADGNSVEFSFDFAIFQSEDLQVFLDASLQADGFTIRGGYPSDGGTVVFQQAPAAATVVTLQRRLSIERASDFQPSGALVANTLNGEFDRLVAMLQQVDENTSRAVRAGPTEAGADLLLPAREARAGRILGFDEAGNVTMLAASLPELPNLDAISEGADNKHFTSAEKIKLATIEPQSEANPPHVTAEEKENGSELSLRSFAPRDIADIARICAPAGAVSSVFGRTGAVGAEAGDYKADQITDTANKVMMTSAERAKLAGFVTVAEFGAVGDGMADDALALQKALDSGKMVLVPSGVYRLASSIAVSGKSVCLIGTGINNTTLIFDGATQGISITVDVPSRSVRIEDMSILTSTALSPTKTAIKIDGSALAADPDPSDPWYTSHAATKITLDRTASQVYLANLRIHGTTTAVGWGRGIDTITVGQWVYSNIVIRGALDASNSPKGIGFLIRGYGIPVETVIRDCHSYHLEYGILIPDNMERLLVSCSTFVYVDVGIHQAYTDGLSVVAKAYCKILDLCVSDSHINGLRVAIFSAYADQCRISNNLLYVQNNSRFSAPVGIAIFGGYGGRISYNSFTELLQRKGSGITAVYLEASNGTIISDNSFVGCSTGINLAVGSSYSAVRGNVFTSVNTAVVQSSTSTGNSITNSLSW